MKIAFVFPYNVWGGAFRSTFELANHLQGSSVTIIYPFIPPSALRMSGSIQYLLRGIVRSLLRGSRVKWIDHKTHVNTQLIPFISKKYLSKYDVVIANHWHTWRPVFNAVGKEKTILFLRDVEQWSNYSVLQKDDIKLPVPKIAVSPWVSDFIRQYSGRPADLVLPNGVNLQRFNSSGKIWTAKTKIILLCYSEHKMKGMDYAYRILQKLKYRLKSELDIRIFGFPSDPCWNFEYTYIKKPVGNELASLYQSSHFFLGTSKQEGFFNPPFEAMASKCVVFSTIVGGLAYLAKNDHDYVSIPFNKTDETVKILCEYFNQYSKLQELSENGYNLVKTLAWNERAKNLKVFLDAR